MRLMSRAALALAATLFAAPVYAQTSFSLAAGASLPIGSTADDVVLGYNVTAGIGIKPPVAPLGLRVEGMYNAMDAKSTAGNSRIIAATANVTFSGPGMPIPMGYLIGGLGMYNGKFVDRPALSGRPAGDSNASTNIGFNIGAGLNFPLTGFGTYGEIRLHYVGGSEKLKFVPITFGIKF